MSEVVLQVIVFLIVFFAMIKLYPIVQKMWKK